MAAVIALGLLAASAAGADDGRAVPRDVLPAYTQECASCHTAYPPGMLPAGSWQRVMAGLGKHYGTDASLDSAGAQQIGAWLQAHAGTYKRVKEMPPQDRITRSDWFERKHRKVAATVWQLPSVKTPANCSACHGGADRGEFDDDHLIQPAGMSPQQRASFRD